MFCSIQKNFVDAQHVLYNSKFKFVNKLNLIPLYVQKFLSYELQSNLCRSKRNFLFATPCFPSRDVHSILKNAPREILNSIVIWKARERIMDQVVRPVFAVLYLVREFFRVVLCTHWFLNPACVCQTMAGIKRAKILITQSIWYSGKYELLPLRNRDEIGHI